MDSEVLKSKFLGSLMGTAIGDAVGAGFEGRYRARREEIAAEADRKKTLVYTDDTHMMIGVAESIVQCKGFDGEHMAYTFMNNYESEPWRGYGPGPPYLFRLIRDGEDWDRVAARVYHGGSYGNGSAMRIAPVGVFYYDDFLQLKDVSFRSSQITHSHELGKEGAALQAFTVALAANIEPSEAINAKKFLDELNRVVSHEIYRKKLVIISDLLTETPGPGFSDLVARLGNGIEAYNSVPTAIYSFLSHPLSFKEAVLCAISLGGDTDTIGAMTGAISGAYLGVDSIPGKWQMKLENRLYIAELAQRLWQIKLPGNSS